MDKTIREYTDFDEMKADEYRYWQSRPVHERLAAVSEVTEEAYSMKGMGPDAFRLQRTVVHFERAPSSREDLIAAKLASGRRDLADVDEMRKAEESQLPKPSEEKPSNPTGSK